MIKINRTTEYGLIALRHMSQKHVLDTASVTSAREIADHYGLPFEITAKTLQRLKDTGLILSAQGAKGGYTLHRALTDVTLAEFLELMEGPHSLVSCIPTQKSSASCGCEYLSRCEIKGMMSSLNARFVQFLSGIPLADIATHPTSFAGFLGGSYGQEP